MYQYRLYRAPGLISRTYSFRGCRLISVPSWQCTPLGRLLVRAARLLLGPLATLILLLGPWLLGLLISILLG